MFLVTDVRIRPGWTFARGSFVFYPLHLELQPQMLVSASLGRHSEPGHLHHSDRGQVVGLLRESRAWDLTDWGLHRLSKPLRCAEHGIWHI